MLTPASRPRVGIICALSLELKAVLATFDEIYKTESRGEDLDIIWHPGRIGHHDVVAVCLPQTGSVAASIIAGHMPSAYSLNRRFMFLVGVAGGIPQYGHDIRLGDVIVGTKIAQYDFGKRVPDGRFLRKLVEFDAPEIVQNVLQEIDIDGMDECRQRLDEILSAMRKRQPRFQLESTGEHRWTYPGDAQDHLFEADYQHFKPDDDNCEKCDKGKRVSRKQRADLRPEVHRGPIGSANQVMRDGKARDALRSAMPGKLAVEMEAAGLRSRRAIVIRGICDYSDSHKNKKWQDYAAATAAACTKLLLEKIPGNAGYSNGSDQMQPRVETWMQTDPEDHTPLHPAIESPTFATNTPSRLGDIHRRAHTVSVPGSTRREPNITILPQTDINDFGGDRFDCQAMGNNVNNHGPQAMPLRPNCSPTSAHRSLEMPETQPFPQEVELFSTSSIDKYSVTFSDRPDERGKHTYITNHKSKMKLLQSVGDEFFMISRKLVLQSTDRGPDLVPLTLWLPFDKVLVALDGHVVKLKFSNCNSKHSGTRQGLAQYSAYFDPELPNIEVSLIFSDENEARYFSNQVLCLNCDIDYHHKIDLSQQPVRSSQDMEFTLYRCFEDRGRTRDKSKLLAIVSNAKHGYRRSEAFFLGSNLVFELTVENMQVEFGGFHTIQYLSHKDAKPFWPFWPPPWVKENPEGIPQQLALSMSPAIKFRFLDEQSYQNLMKVITGWRLNFTGNTKFRSFRDTGFLKGFDSCQVTLWSNTSESGFTKCHVLIHLHKAQHTVNRWRSVVLKAPGHIVGTAGSSRKHRTRDASVILDGVEFFEGTYIERSTMLAGSSTEQPVHHQKLKFEFKFENASVSERFADALQVNIDALSGTRMPSESS